MKKIIFISFVMFLLPINILFAQQEAAQCGSESYNAQECYTNPGFLRSSDTSKWKLEYVNWNEPLTYQRGIYNRNEIYSKPEVYNSQYFYQNLPDGKYSLLNYRLVNYDYIENHNKIDSTKYLKDLGCDQCSLNRGNQNLKFSKNGLTHTKGGFVSIPGNYPRGSLFIGTNDRIMVRVPEGSIVEVSNKDEVTIDSGDKSFVLNIGRDARIFSGKLSYSNGQPYIRGDDFVIIEGVEIKALRQDIPLPREKEAIRDNEILLFIDGNPHYDVNRDYVSLNEKSGNLFAYTNYGKGISLDFKEGNKFLDFEKDDFAHIEMKKSDLLIQNRRTIDLIPLVNIKEHAADSQFKIQSGIVTINGKGKSIATDFNNPSNKKSSPMAVIISNADGSLLGSQQEPKKILISNFNELATVPLNQQEGLEGEKTGDIQHTVSERLYYDYDAGAAREFKERFPNIALYKDYNPKYYDINKLIDYLDGLPKEVKDSIRGIAVVDGSNWRDIQIKYYGSADVNEPRGFAHHSRNIWLSSDAIDTDTIYHEAAHTLTFDKENYRFMNNFVSQWKSVAGDVYGKDLSTKNYARNTKSSIWYDGSDGPKNGCVEAYGCNDHYEDIATFAVKTSNPDFFKPLISQGSPQYDARYRNKLDLLYQNGFISKERYEVIVADKKVN